MVVEMLEERLIVPPAADTPSLLNVEQAAAYLSLSPSTVYKLSSRGELPHVKLGGRLRFRRGDLDAYIERHKAGRDEVLAHARSARAREKNRRRS
jgi:excisionase family DNA binding protein